MPRRTIQLDNRTIVFSPDDPVLPVDRFQAIIKVRVTDELTGAAPNSRTTLDVKERGFFPRLGSDGLGGLVGLPRQVFPALQARDYQVNQFMLDAMPYFLTLVALIMLGRKRVDEAPEGLREVCELSPTG